MGAIGELRTRVRLEPPAPPVGTNGDNDARDHKAGDDELLRFARPSVTFVEDV